ncbi:MAG TPA: protein kinase [Candidatus Baltobacteraceae bacterium]|nr:protein kinase [Candidatus Baltobacteraceae bacterium]
MIDENISHFRVIEKLGAGGMGVVYKAIDTRLDRPVALKFLPDKMAQDSQALERFRREARAASALNHPGICTIYDIGEQAGRTFIAMEFIDGETLRAHIQGKPLPLDETLKLGIQLAEALDAAHTQGIIHRDIKPANIFVTKRGQAKVLDFGLAKLVPKGVATADTDSNSETSDSTSIVGIISGTPAYMSPEQVRGDNLDPRTDIFSLGLLLYEMATGRQAFNGPTGGAVIEAVLTRSPAPARTINPSIPPRLEEIISKALHKNRDQRYQHAADIRADLQQMERGPDSGWRANDPITQTAQPSSSPDLHSTGEHRAQNPSTQTGTLRPARVSKIIDSLAVLPFENSSRDPEHEYLSDGIAGSLINILAAVPKLRVMAQSTVFRFKGRGVDPQSVGRELNVRAVLTGRIMQSGGSLRIGAELVDVATGSRIWGAQYDRKPGDIFAIQDEISNEIWETLKLKLTRAEKKRLTKHQTDDAEAYRLYLKGRHHWNKWTEDGFYKAIEYFHQAVEKDSAYALAHTGIADSYILLGWNSYLPPKDAFPKAKAAALTALRLDPDLGEAHTPMAAVLWLYDWQWPEAQAEFQHSIALNFAHPTASHWYAECLMTIGRQAEAIAGMKKSQELDPLSLIIGAGIGWAHYMARQYDAAIEQLHRTIELDPNYPVTYWILGLILRKLGRYDQAIAEGEKSVKFSGGSPMLTAALAQTLATAGRKKEAIQLLDELTQLAKQKYVAPCFFAGIHLGLGESDRAIECLEKSFDEHSHWLIYLHIDPSMDALRPDPRFQDLLRRIGLPLKHALPT